MSAIALAKYLIHLADKQESILHNSRFTRTPIVAANQEAIRPIRAYLCDPRRPQGLLEAAKETLLAKARSGQGTPKSRDEARRCAEIITLFQNQENALGLRRLPLSGPPIRFAPLVIAGVSLSIEPDFMVNGAAGRVGSGMLHVAKTPDLSDCLPETRDIGAKSPDTLWQCCRCSWKRKTVPTAPLIAICALSPTSGSARPSTPGPTIPPGFALSRRRAPKSPVCGRRSGLAHRFCEEPDVFNSRVPAMGNW